MYACNVCIMHSMNHTFIRIRVRKTPSKNDKYHTFALTVYYEVNKPNKWKKNIKKMRKKTKIKHKNV